MCIKENAKSQQINIIGIQQNKNFYKIKENIDINGYNLYWIVNAKAEYEIEKAVAYRYISTDLKILDLDETRYKIFVKDEDDVETYVVFKKDLESKVTKDAVLNVFNKNKDYEFQIVNIDSLNYINIKEQTLSKLQEELYKKLRKSREDYRPRQVCTINNDKNIKYPYEKLSCLENVVNKKAESFF